MYCVLILLVTVGFAQSHCHGFGYCPWRHRHPWHHNHRHQTNFGETTTTTGIEEIKRNYINAELAFQKYCKENTNAVTEELYGADMYFLKYRLSEAQSSRVKIQITHRIVHTIVEGTNGSKILEDVRLLPDTVNTNKAVWTARSGGFDITVPYKVAPGTLREKKCEDVNKNVIDVPSVVYPQMILRSKPDSGEYDVGLGPTNNVVY